VLHAGNRILLADGSLSIEVTEILNDRELKGRVLNSKSLGERKNCNLPGAPWAPLTVLCCWNLLVARSWHCSSVAAAVLMVYYCARSLSYFGTCQSCVFVRYTLGLCWF
jgi:hypothetical protein